MKVYKVILTITVIFCVSWNSVMAKDINPVNSESNIELNKLIQSNINWDTYSWTGGVRPPEIEFRIDNDGNLEYKYLKLLMVRFSKNEKLCFDALDASVPFPSKFRNNTYTLTCELDSKYSVKDFKQSVKERRQYLDTIKAKIKQNSDLKNSHGVLVDFKISKDGKVFDVMPGAYTLDDEAYKECKNAIEKLSPFAAPNLDAFARRFVAQENQVEISLLCD